MSLVEEYRVYTLIELEMKENKTILIVHNYYKISGGEDIVVQNEKNLLEDKGHKVVLFTRDNNNLRLRDYLSTFFSWKTFFEIRNIIVKEKIDIVHVHNTLNLITPAVYYAAISKKKPVFQTMHNFRLLCPGALFLRDGNICEECINKGVFYGCKYGCYRKSRIQTFISALNTYIHKKTGIYNKIRFIALSDFNKEKLAQNFKSKIYVKPNFTFNPERFEDVDSPFDNYYVFVGRIEDEKGIKILLKAFKNSNKNLIIAGTGSRSKDVDCLIKKYRMSNIHMMGYLERHQLNAVVRNAKALIMPSQWYETFGMTIIEAYSVGTPVIAGNIGNIGLLVNDRVTGLKFKYNSSKSLQNKIDEFETLDRNELSKNAYLEFKEKYSPEVNYKMLMDIYNSTDDL